MNQTELKTIEEQILFRMEGMNKILLTSEIELPEKMKKSKNKNYGNTHFYDAKLLKELDKNFLATENQNKRVFVTDWVQKAVKVGQIKIAQNSRVKNIPNGEYISVSFLKEILKKNLNFEIFDDFQEEYAEFLKHASHLKLAKGKKEKVSSRYISLKEKNKLSYARNVELYFAKYAFFLPDDEYVCKVEAEEFLKGYLKKKEKKELPSIVVRSKVSEFEEIKKLKDLEVDKKRPRNNFWKVERNLLPSVVVRNLNLDIPTYEPRISDQIRSNNITSLQEKKKWKRKKKTLVPFLVTSALALLSGTVYQEPTQVDVESKTTTQNVSYEVNKFHVEPIFESKEDQETRLLSNYTIGKTIDLPKGTNLYASSDHNYGGNAKYGALKEDKTLSIDRIVLLKDGQIICKEQTLGMSVLDCYKRYGSNCEVVLHVSQGWVDLQDLKKPFEEKQIGSKMVTEEIITGEIKNYEGTCLLEDNIDISDMNLNEVKTKEGASYFLKEFHITEEETSTITTVYTEGNWEWNLKNISKKKALLLESLGLLSTVLWNRKKNKVKKRVKENHDSRLK